MSSATSFAKSTLLKQVAFFQKKEINTFADIHILYLAEGNETVELRINQEQMSKALSLSFLVLLANSVDDKLVIFFLFFPENRI